MAELSGTKLNHSSHIQMDQPFLRLPYELHRNNFKAAQRNIEQTQSKVEELIRAALRNVAGNGRESESSIDAATSRLKTLKAKLQALEATQQSLVRQSDARLAHLEELYTVSSLADVGYERWGRTRLNRLIVDYMARLGFMESARQLVADKGLEELVDVDEFEAVGRIVHSLRVEHRVEPAMAWCGENKQNLRKLQENTFEFELRLQQFIEMIRTGEPDKLIEATLHARKYLTVDGQIAKCIHSAGLLAFDADSDTEPYSSLFSKTRWDMLADLFLATHHQIFCIPHRPLLNITLTAGLSALKTPACHSEYISPTSGLFTGKRSISPDGRVPGSFSPAPLSDADELIQQAALHMVNTPVCPICSFELNELARPLPFAHHSKSIVENDPVMLPNGRIYGRERLMRLNDKLGTLGGHLRDPVEPDRLFDEKKLRKVYIT